MTDRHNDRHKEDELEQLRVAVEDAQDEIAALTAERDQLAGELQRKSRDYLALRTQLRDGLNAAQSPREAVDPDRDLLIEKSLADHASLAEELRVSLEELQVFAEELESANVALLRSNDELEHRVAARTAELEKANAKSRESEAMLRLAQQHAGAGAWDWDIPSKRLSWSPENYQLHGLDPASGYLSYEAWLETLPREDRAGVHAAFSQAMERCDPDYRIDYRVQTPQGERWLSARGRIICGERGKPVRVLGLNIDVTDRKRAEVALAQLNAHLREEVEHQVREREDAQARLFQNLKLEALGQLTGGVAHDFNNLLSVIISSATLLRQSSDAEARERLLASVEQAAHRGAALTQRLLTFSRRQSLHPEPIDIGAWLHDIRDLLARSLRADIAIETDAPEGVWPALADPGELELSLLNLAVNARDAMPKGGCLRISARNVDLDPHTDPDALAGAFVSLSIEDTGTGMAPEILARAFEPFFTTKEVGQGTGLGLAQVYGFARQSGGGARLASAAGQGTAVTILLPRAAEAPPSAGAGPHPIPALDEEEGRILLVEDDPDVAELTGEMLRHLGYSVLRVDSASAALDVMHTGASIDLVLTDVLMPGGQAGLDLAERLLQERPDLPILLCSGYGGAPQRVAAAGLSLLRKPFTMRQLKQAVAQVRGGKASTESRA